MAGEKETYQIQLNPDQMGFIRNAQGKYKIPDESQSRADCYGLSHIQPRPS